MPVAKLTPVKAKMALRYKFKDVNLALLSTYSINRSSNIWEPEKKYRNLSLSVKLKFNKEAIS